MAFDCIHSYTLIPHSYNLQQFVLAQWKSKDILIQAVL